MLSAYVVAYLPLLYRRAWNLLRRLPAKVDVNELISDGFIGLQSAAARFDPTRGVPFGAYAQRRIDGAMADGLHRRLAEQLRHSPFPEPLVEPTDFIEMMINREFFRRALDVLPPQGRLVLQLYYRAELNMPQIAKMLEVTISRISQVHGRSIRFLRAWLNGDRVRASWEGEVPCARKTSRPPAARSRRTGRRAA